MSNPSEELVYIGTGPDGILFTDGVKLYMVWPSDTSEFVWAGHEVGYTEMAFPGIDGDGYCGAEIDMRRSDKDSMTEEIMALGDRVAAFLTRHINHERRTAHRLWKIFSTKD